MGSRLVVSIKHNNIRIAAIYYHWGAFNYSASNIVNGIAKHVEKNRHLDDEAMRLSLIRYCESNGGGLRGKQVDWDYATAAYPQETFEKDKVHRNYGLITMTQDGFDSFDWWSEGDASIDYNDDDATIHVNVPLFPDL